MTEDFQGTLDGYFWFLWLCRKILQHHDGDMLLPEPHPVPSHTEIKVSNVRREFGLFCLIYFLQTGPTFTSRSVWKPLLCFSWREGFHTRLPGAVRVPLSQHRMQSVQGSHASKKTLLSPLPPPKPAYSSTYTPAHLEDTEFITLNNEHNGLLVFQDGVFFCQPWLALLFSGPLTLSLIR